MKFFLDENFPLRLLHRLQAESIDSEHLITLGQRGIPDAEVVEHLAEGDVVLLTQDREFEYLPLRGGKVIISRVSQSLPKPLDFLPNGLGRTRPALPGAVRPYSFGWHGDPPQRPGVSDGPAGGR